MYLFQAIFSGEIPWNIGHFSKECVPPIFMGPQAWETSAVLWMIISIDGQAVKIWRLVTIGFLFIFSFESTHVGTLW